MAAAALVLLQFWGAVRAQVPTRSRSHRSDLSHPGESRSELLAVDAPREPDEHQAR